MRDSDCVKFLKRTLPELSCRWEGFRKVRSQVCKRLGRRLADLGLRDLDGYRYCLGREPAEWKHLARLLRITISRFYRDRAVFNALRWCILPELGRHGEAPVRAWSAGCASGEEVYTLKLICHHQKVSPEIRQQPASPDSTATSASSHCRTRPSGCSDVLVVATDIDRHMLLRAQKGVYPDSALRELPEAWCISDFCTTGEEHRIREEFKSGILWVEMDLRDGPPASHFDLILCRNLAFTYFDESLQQKIQAQI